MQIDNNIYYLSTLFFVSFIITYLIKIYISKNYLLTESLKNESRKIHSDRIVRIGSISFILLSLIIFKIENTQLINILLLSFFCFLIGLVEDVTFSFSYLTRLFLILLFIIIFVIKNNFIIDSFDNNILDLIFLENDILLYLFSIIGLLIIINGFNFIDGLNGLLFGYTILILTVYFFSSYKYNHEISLICISTICVIVPIAIFNLKYGTILAGDSGAYFLGALIGTMSIIIANSNILTAFEIAFFISYPAIELIFTGFRRIVNRKNPFKPDGQHLHQLLYRSYINLLSSKNIDMSKKYINNISSFTILILISCLFIIHYFLKDLFGLELFLFLSISIYFLSYFLLSRNLKNYL